MINSSNILDVINAFLWCLTYLVGLIYLVATRRALISPLFSLIVVPWELAFVIRDLPKWFSDIPINWSETGRLMFLLFHLPIVFLLLFRSPSLKNKKVQYLYSLILLSLFYLILYKINWNFQFILGFMITVVGCSLWIVSLFQKNIPINALQILVSFIPTVADSLAILFYAPESVMGFVLSFILIGVHIVHLIVAIVLFVKTNNYSHKKQQI